MDNLLRVEFHCHTHYSRDSLTDIDRLVATARQNGVERLVITDHNTIQGALKARDLDPELVIVGEELLTTRGELLVAFVQEELPRGLEPMIAIEKLKAQGAFISVSHPFDLRRHGWALPDLQAITPYVDAIEVFNARCQWSGINRLAADYAREHQLCGTAGSDAHTLREVGRATFQVTPFQTADDLRKVMPQASIAGRLSSPFIHLTSTYARLYKQLKGKK